MVNYSHHRSLQNADPRTVKELVLSVEGKEQVPAVNSPCQESVDENVIHVSCSCTIHCQGTDEVV